MIDKLILQDLTELLERHELAVYLGPDLPEALGGVPGWPDLAIRLAERGGFTASDWPMAAARYDQLSGRRNLIDWLDGQINGRPPGPFYSALAKLPISKYISTTYDELLQSSLQAAGREPNIVIEDGDLTSLKNHRPTVVKLFGEVSAGRREALLLTSGDLRELTQRRAAILAQEVQPVFTRTSLLILGQDPRAKFFRDIYHQYAEQAGPLKRRSFAVWSGLERWEIDDWKTDEVAVLDIDPIELIDALLNTEGKATMSSPIISSTVTTKLGGGSTPFQNQNQVMSNYENAVFVSYAWGGESEFIVDELEQAFRERGIRIVRDKKDLDYKGSIKAFEQRIGKGQCIVLVISDKYLRSEHCMYELVEVEKNQNLRDRIFPIVLTEAQIYKALNRLNYIKYWEEQIEQLDQAIKGVKVMSNLSGFTADLDKYARIRASFDHLTDLLSDMNALTPEMHTVNGFSTLIDAVVGVIENKK
jgi:hypothetical protein